ncbi:arsenate reductase family protein [Liquorilactobacillus capillatus]|uniref:Arsenate reductase n=1 Tax=Liquorilactobacillus capillatus DSM 19910 TaxID=1423731 RepID=A0A0R1LWS7_9LACO|nr:arsenate reductase family protein [Liquorilactobacillus capillatus]KRL00124.1 arsenate reductase [Liquorilactobacillus capillatus DSM 19910]
MKIFYCYNRCSTCRKAQKWLDENAVEYTKIDLIKEPPVAKQLAEWIKNSERPLKYFFNTSGIKYRELQLKNKVPTMDIQEASRLLASDGKLIKRPLLVEGDHVTCGFKENVYEAEWK